MERAYLKPNEERRLLRGHAWAYRNEFERLPQAKDGEVVDVYTQRRRFVARGFYQAVGGIAVRILARRQHDIDDGFLARRIDQAHALRKRTRPGHAAYRWIHGESDGLPGFVADRYGPVVIAESSCAFYASYADALAETFLAYPGVEGARVTVRGKAHELGALAEELTVDVGGLTFGVPLNGGQKTGLFLDQQDNVLAARPLAEGARVLDGHCYAGVWSCHAAAAGARSVTGVDTSEAAIARAQANAERNGVADRCAFETAAIGDALKRGERYDLIILDPPALAKSRGHVQKARSAYQTLNANAMAALEPGGFLVTSSCSQSVDRAVFTEILKRAARAAQRDAVLLDFRGAPPDHPVLLQMPETAYLTCAVLQVH